jgi:hypothetical protein
LLELSVLLSDDMNAQLARDGLTVARAICCGNCGAPGRSPNAR